MSQPSALIINGSPRIHGNTSWLSSRVYDALMLRGIQVTPVVASQLRTSNTGCIGCKGCQKSERFMCVFKDEVQPLVASMPSHRYVIFATPVYFYGPTAQIKPIVDRMFSLLKANDDGSFRHPFTATKFGLIITSGGPYDHGSDLVVESFKRTAYSFQCPLETFLMNNTPFWPEEIEDTSPYERQADDFCERLIAG